jgi:hypothetical protein
MMTHDGDVSFDVRFRVFLSASNTNLRVSSARKLRPRWIGPIESMVRVGVIAYKLQLSRNMKIHNVLHVPFLNIRLATI